jgi:hypothetical protein
MGHVCPFDAIAVLRRTLMATLGGANLGSLEGRQGAALAALNPDYFERPVLPLS